MIPNNKSQFRNKLHLLSLGKTSVIDVPSVVNWFGRDIWFSGCGFIFLLSNILSALPLSTLVWMSSTYFNEEGRGWIKILPDHASSIFDSNTTHYFWIRTSKFRPEARLFQKKLRLKVKIVVPNLFFFKQTVKHGFESKRHFKKEKAPSTERLFKKDHPVYFNFLFQSQLMVEHNSSWGRIQNPPPP